MGIKVFLPYPDRMVELMFTNYGEGDYNVVHNINDADIVVFTGGADISPHLYNEKAINKTNSHPPRDKVDTAYYKLATNLPKVGICRGGQFLNVMAGGEMWQHVENHGRSHDITDLLFGRKELRVSSTHHQMMVPGEGAQVIGLCDPRIGSDYTCGYKVGVSTKDSPIREVPRYDTEVVWYEKQRSLCFQPHPELNGYSDCRQYFFDLIDHLIL